MKRFLFVLLLLPVWNASAQIFKLPHPDSTAGNFFGTAVALDGRRALVSAPAEDACGVDSGAAYLFELDATTEAWTRIARLVANDCEPGRFFGRSAALSGDRVMISASREFFAQEISNAVYIFEPDSLGMWRQVGRLTSPGGQEEGAFATSVALDGDRALITTSGDPGDARYHGAAYIFERDPATNRWTQKARLTSPSGTRNGILGGAGALDGDRAVVAASTYFRERPGSVYVFERDPATGQWREAARFGDIDGFNISVAVSGDQVLVGESKDGRRSTGAASLYARDASGKWAFQAKMRPAHPYELGGFGTAVALEDGLALVAGYDEQLRFNYNIDRVVYVFAPDASGTWKQRHVIDVGELAFGAAVALDDGHALVGQASEQQPGAAYVVKLR